MTLATTTAHPRAPSSPNSGLPCSPSPPTHGSKTKPYFLKPPNNGVDPPKPNPFSPAHRAHPPNHRLDRQRTHHRQPRPSGTLKFARARHCIKFDGGEVENGSADVSGMGNATGFTKLTMPSPGSASNSASTRSWGVGPSPNIVCGGKRGRGGIRGRVDGRGRWTTAAQGSEKGRPKRGQPRRSVRWSARQTVQVPPGCVRVVWRSGKKGLFTIRSAYGVVMELAVRPLASSSRPFPVLAEGCDSFWGRLWAMGVPPRVRLQTWRFCYEAVPSMDNLAK
ncbi:hypothetical protein Salat_2629100 [Sesamum alatum]|uniref:Reverse transcriptase zinc-binding domain-containing protein n=1 Tax=Sesamum alatum TaxID=300844 RepID=A0AAE2CAM9_9LAMI|nr:hypothetical protein Salat_2629100 [Sesamum alatum]